MYRVSPFTYLIEGLLGQGERILVSTYGDDSLRMFLSDRQTTG
jgi:hypothetical protein